MQHLPYRKVAHEVGDRNGFAHGNLTPQMVKTLCHPTPTPHLLCPSLMLDPNEKYGSITMINPAMLQIPEQMQAAVGAAALQTDGDQWVVRERWDSVLLIALDFEHRFLPLSVILCTHADPEAFAATAVGYSVAPDAAPFWMFYNTMGHLQPSPVLWL